MTPLRIIFMGTPDFSVQALQALIDSPHVVVGVYTQPPRPKGRGHKVIPSPVDHLASTHDIPVYTPESLKSAGAQEEFKSLNADVAVVAAYGLILPKAILDAPRYGCLNIHASLLPRWRGASPIQHAIWQGDHETGITIMQMDEGLDTGDMIAKRSVAITSDTTTSVLHDQLSALGAEMITKTIGQLAGDALPPAEPQHNEQSSYAPMLQKSDGHIDWTRPAVEIDRQIRALNPWPGTFTDDFKIKSAVLSDQTTDKVPGTILDKKGHIACGDGSVLQLMQIQPPGKQAMDFVSALNGGYVYL